jgi:hypothetical protein
MIDLELLGVSQRPLLLGDQVEHDARPSLTLMVDPDKFRQRERRR